MKGQPVKLGKIIAIMVLSVLLVLSTFFNVFFLAIFGIKDAESFRRALLNKELLDELTDVTDVTEETTVPDVDYNPSDATESVVVFNEEGIKITYIKQETGLLGPSFKFLIENNSIDSIYVSFTDVYVDGYLTDLSGGSTLSDLAPSKKTFVSLTVWESDYEEFTDSPTNVDYTILIVNADTWETIAEVDDKELTIK
jgi:hypothetical protein